MNLLHKATKVFPGAYVNDGTGSFRRVAEYPIVTAKGVYINMIGAQLGPLPEDADVEVWHFDPEDI